MNKLAIFAIFTVVASVFLVSYNPSQDNGLQDQFDAFIREYRKSYATEDEMQFRFKIFEESMTRAAELNKAHPKAQFGVTKFSDMTNEEFGRGLGKNFSEGDPSDYVVPKLAGPNASIDFRPIMQPVQAQSTCGSCWAFASTATVEGRYCWQKNICIKNSEQELVDCVYAPGTGCKGGDEIDVYRWLAKTPACTSSSYPYEAVSHSYCDADQCQHTVNTSGGNKVAGEQNILGALQNGPVSIGLNFDEWPQYYQGGIVTADLCTQTRINHAIVAVGFQEDSQGGYWIVRNSHGSNWGESGHFRLEYGTSACQMGKDASYPTL